MIGSQPLAFDGCFGRLWRASSRRGVVLCPPFGLDGLTARRAYADLAARLAAHGLSALVFDWAGTGDSLGSDRDPDRLAAWKASLHAAIETLRRETGVTEIALVGLRLGATLAVDVANERDDIAVFVAAAPVVSGRTFVREQRALSRMLRVRAEDEPADSDETGGFAVAGFFTADATANDIAALDCRHTPRCPAPRLLLLPRDGDVAATELAAHWRNLGAEVAVQPFDGLDALLSDPTRAVVPEATWVTIVAHLARDIAPTEAPDTQRAPAPAVLDGAGWREEALHFGPGGGLFGVLTVPADPRPGPWVVLLDAGRNPHVGWGRQSVELARDLAASGRFVLRMDQAGVGDSSGRPDGPAEVLYSMEAIADVRAALDLLAMRGAARFALIGACSGAHLALHTALADPRVAALVPINLQRFVWRDGDSLEAAMRGEFRASSAYAGLLRRPDTWRRIVAGDIKVVAIAIELIRRIARRIGGALRARFVVDPALRWLRDLDRRGVRTLFVFGTDDGGRDEFALHLGTEAALPTLCPKARVALIERTDHNLGPRDARLRFGALVAGLLAEFH